MGLGDWRLIVALLSSFVAKENSVATLGVLFGGARRPPAEPRPAPAWRPEWPPCSSRPPRPPSWWCR